jgi:hypothetical protein
VYINQPTSQSLAMLLVTFSILLGCAFATSFLHCQSTNRSPILWIVHFIIVLWGAISTCYLHSIFGYAGSAALAGELLAFPLYALLACAGFAFFGCAGVYLLFWFCEWYFLDFHKGEPPILKSPAPFVGHWVGIMRHHSVYLENLA